MENHRAKIEKKRRITGFCVRRAEVQNSTAVFHLNFSNKTSFCASISRPNAKPRNVIGQSVRRESNTQSELEKSKKYSKKFSFTR